MNKFECKCCGDCCSGEMEIRLNLYDLYKMSKHLGFSNSKELFEKEYIELKPGQNGLDIPLIKFKSKPYKFCPFLINDINENMDLHGYCSLHPYIKPLVCILAPVSKFYSTKKETTEYIFTKPTENCPGGSSYTNNIDIELPDNIKKEIYYEHSFFYILEKIIEKSTKLEIPSLYYIDSSKDFTKTLKELSSV